MCGCARVFGAFRRSAAEIRFRSLGCERGLGAFLYMLAELRVKAFVVVRSELLHLGVGFLSLGLGCVWLRTLFYLAYGCRPRSLGLGRSWLRARRGNA